MTTLDVPECTQWPVNLPVSLPGPLWIAPVASAAGHGLGPEFSSPEPRGNRRQSRAWSS